MINFYKNRITFPFEENAFKVRIRIDGGYAGTVLLALVDGSLI